MRTINFLEELQTYQRTLASRKAPTKRRPKYVIEFPQDLSDYRLEVYDRLPSPTDLTKGLQ
jgi:hypothetical protein